QEGGQVAMPKGFNLFASVLSGVEGPRKGVGASYTFQEGDSGSIFTYSGSGAGTWTIPRTISPTNVQRWGVWLVNTQATPNTVTIVPGSGTTLYEAGNSVSSAPLTRYVPYQLLCPINPGGNMASCFLTP